MKDLTQGKLLNHLYHLALPSIGGMLAFSLFNLTDTYFVGKLGTESLAAMGFTFPIVMIAGAISSGISTGAASVISRAAGNKDRKTMRRTATDGILLSIVIVAIFSTLGLLTMDLLFPLLGAKGDTLPLVKSYMTVWYSFVIVVLMPPIGDAAMRAVGDTYRPFKVMITCALLNMILDPIFIFGWLGFPALGIQGAAIATVISRAVGMVMTLSFNHFYHQLIDFHVPKYKEILDSWSKILTIGIPGIGVSLIPQLVRMALTTLAAYTGGTLAVAAVAAGSRIEGFSLMIATAIGISIVPLVGQNYGAGAFDRVKDIRRLLNRASFVVGTGMFLLILVIAKPVVLLFTQDPAVVGLTVTYLRVMTIASIGLNLYNFTNQSLNAIGQSLTALKINAFGTICILLPLMFFGSRISFTLLIAGLATGQVLVGMVSMYFGNRILAPTNLKALSEKAS
ncbi:MULTISPECIES: MATE family efflux transporter [unclassified Fusibacter]|uniref:MATE family efflux transporter n=1 Tax=unclassified Fusibacter TaxID=2624464 RepID=UPI0010110CD4|nr:MULTISPECIES: MATE family efflux transporter [unclassified Fusibacter]MCK8060339.1 MATE family efflux transporter [Fusibacter sp. A2]NPE20372.1 MATE family efflux transporter [Fusibacter sp. A1]RXV63578.1 MATE family efflux transporter [Fusibacter sp. A1]